MTIQTKNLQTESLGNDDVLVGEIYADLKSLLSNDVVLDQQITNVASTAASLQEKVDAARHVPENGTTAQFLRGDNTWQNINNLIGQGITGASLATNGWVKFANGLILQWGQNASPVTFPIAFPSAVLQIVPQLQASNDSSNMSKNRVYISASSKTGFSVQNPQSSGTYRYIAIGN